MRVRGRRLLATGIALASSLAAFAALAQDAADDVEPAVDTSAVFDEVDTLEPAVDTSAEAAEADAEMTLGRTEITGNQELPKVLYIVPWQKAQPGELTGRPVNTLLDEVLAPLDRDEFTRQVDYYGELYGNEE